MVSRSSASDMSVGKPSRLCDFSRQTTDASQDITLLFTSAMNSFCPKKKKNPHLFLCGVVTTSASRQTIISTFSHNCESSVKIQKLIHYAQISKRRSGSCFAK